MIKTFIPVITILFLCNLSFAQDDFKWSWEGGEKSGKSKAENRKEEGDVSRGGAAIADEDVSVEDVDMEDLPELEVEGEPVNWDFDAGQDVPEEKQEAKSGNQKDPVEKTQPPVTDNSTTQQPNNSTASVVDDKALKELLQENLKLREEIDQMQLSSKVNQQENERLVRQVAELEKNIKQLGGLIDKYDDEKKASGDDADKVVALELKLTEVESEKIKLENEREKLKGDLVALEKKMRETPKVTVPKKAAPGSESDLYKRVKVENMLLKKKMVEIEQERLNAVKERAAILSKEEKFNKMVAESKYRREQLERELNEARAKREQQEKLIGKLMNQIPDLEDKVVNLSAKVEKSEIELVKKDQDINEYRRELDKREDRLKKAERMAALLEKTRAEVLAVNNGEKRDMHFNMAVVYAKEGRLQDAEREYLKALRLDPNDADVHYNLGILYDDELDNKRRAALHYRKYINLKPFATDIDQVRIWLMECEME